MDTAGDSGTSMAQVSLTALAVASARAAETRRPDRLFDDALAQHFIAAAGPDVPFTAGPAESTGPDGAARPGLEPLGDYVAIRTRFFDDFFTEAASAGCRQAVILAAGLDTRAFRLDWPAGTRVFELDMPELVAFKERVLTERAAHPVAERVVVPVDLRTDWPAALLAAGLDADQPTAWLAEGLLPYLTPADADRLLAGISRLSPAGSRLAVEHIDPALFAHPRVRRTNEEIGFPADQLIQGGPGRPPRRWLAEQGWHATAFTVAERARAYGRAVPPIFDPAGPDPVAGDNLVSATRVG